MRTRPRIYHFISLFTQNLFGGKTQQSRRQVEKPAAPEEVIRLMIIVSFRIALVGVTQNTLLISPLVEVK